MKQPLVSVIIPAYNHENYIQATIQSIINQSYKNIELIIVDDGSKDATWQKIKDMENECKKRFERSHFETKENEGTCHTLNKLISLIKGDFVYLIASDDISKYNAIEKQVEFLKENDEYVLVVGDNEFINSDSEVIGLDKHYNSIALYEATYPTFAFFLQKINNINFNSDKFGKYETFCSGNYIPNGYLIRKSALDKVGKFTPNAPLEDYYLHLQLSKIGKMKYIDEVLFSYRLHNNNTVKNANYMSDIVKATKKYEFELVSSMENKKFKEIFERKMIKYKFNLFNIIKFYTKNNFTHKQRILEIFGYKIILKNIEI